MTKYKIICKACGIISGYSETPTVENMPSVCPSCNMERMAIEKVFEAEENSLEFDLFVSNKRTGVSRHNGCVINAEDLKGKSEQEKKNLLIDRLAKTLYEFVKKEENLNILLGGRWIWNW